MPPLLPLAQLEGPALKQPMMYYCARCKIQKLLR
jgi:hypothetical protein